MKKCALVLEGGALRGTFTAGVLDVFIENGIEFSYIVSVSAGSANAMSFITKQAGRSIDCMLAGGENCFYGKNSFKKTGRVMNLDKLFFEYPYKQYPYDFNAYFNSGIRHEMVVTRCRDAKPCYLSETKSEERVCLIGKASCSMPVFCEKVIIDGEAYLDGGLGDPIPVKHALDEGYDKMVVVLTRQDGVYAEISKRMVVANRILYKKYPELIAAYENRHDIYKAEIDYTHELENNGNAFVIRPTEKPVTHFETDKGKLQACYNHGRNIALGQLTELKTFLSEIPDVK